MQSFDIDRIQRMNNLYESVLNDIEQLSQTDTEPTEELFDNLRSNIYTLESYYTGGDWLQDFEADEAGLLPKDMPRGVLSEDGLNDLLDTFRDFEQSWYEAHPIQVL